MRRWAAPGGALLFLLSCALVRGGLVDDRHYGDVALYGHYAHEMTSGRWPYRDFFDEYPPLAQPLFLLVRLLPGSFTSGFRWTMALCGAAAVLLLVRRSATPVLAALACGFAPLLVGPVLLNTYDLFPALLTLAALVALLSGRERTAAVLLGLAVTAKVYPLVVLPVLLLEARRIRSVLAWFCGTVVLVHLPFLVTGPGGLRFSYWGQLKRGLEVESSGGALLLLLDRAAVYHATLRDQPPGSKNVVGTTAQAVATVSSLVLVAAVLLVAWLYVRHRGAPLVAAAAAVCAMVAFNKVFSPQYVAWLVAIVPAAGAVATGGLVAILALTHVVFDRFHTPDSASEHYKAVLTWWVVARDALVVALYVWLVLRLRRTASQR